MINPVPLRNSILLEIDNALVDEISTESGFKLFLAPEWNFEQNVTATGKVANLSKSFSGDLKPSEEVAFSYHVISNRAFPNTSDWFVPISNDDGYVRIWQNGKGEKLRMTAHNGHVSIFWTGVFFDSQGRFIQEKSTQGTEEQVERWMHSNFKFGNCENFIYKNQITINDKSYWKCSLDNVFAKMVDGKIVAIGDRIICKFIDIPLDARQLEINGITMPDSLVAARFFDRAEVLSGGEEIGIEPGDVISFDPQYAETYQLWGQTYCLIRKRRVVGKWVDPTLN